MASLVSEALTEKGTTEVYPAIDVSDSISIQDAVAALKGLMNTKDSQGLLDTVILINAYLIIENGPREAKLIWDKLFDKEFNEVTDKLRGKH